MTRPSSGGLALLVALFVAAACDATSTPVDSGDIDAAQGSDASVSDAGEGPDGALLDAARPDAARSDAGGGMLVLPTPNASFDYQLGEPYAPPAGVEIVSRDRNAAPAPGLYTICYVNAFQTQPDERAFWTTMHPGLLLRDAGGDLVIDPDWDEIILDVTTPESRSALAVIVGGWIDGCAEDGFDAIEIDNLDTYSRSGGLISQDDAVAFMRLLSDIAHGHGLPIAQKNSTEVLGRRSEMGTDFAIAEECNRYSECGDFTAVYGDLVLVIEYRRTDFDAGCRDFPELSIVLRDLNLSAPGSGSYVYDGC